MSTWGLPYMGSKSDIVASLALNFPKADHFYDLFGGGGAITHYMASKKAHWYKHFHYNELEPTTVELFKKAANGDFSYDKFKPEWISREEFFARKDTDAYVRCLWSFGNNQKHYLFSTQIEPYKKSMHMAVVFGEFDELARQVLGFDVWPIEVKTITQRRLYLGQKVAFDSKGKRRGDLQRLEQLERLQQLQQLQRLQELSFLALSYEQVNIEPNSIVYCDIPYKGTAKYISEFDHEKFFDWAASRPFPVYISEYNIDDSRFKLIYSVSKTVKLAQKGMTKENEDLSREKLYWNGKTL